LVSRQNEGLGLTLDFPWETLANSDHHSFFKASIPYLMFHTGEHEDYHRPSDDADKINAEGMRKVTRLITQVLLRLADGPPPPQFRNAARGEDDRDRGQFERPLPPLPPRLGIRWQPSAGEGGTGMIVTSVTRGSAADQAGLRPGDRLLRMAGEEITGDQMFRRQVRHAQGPVSLVVDRPGDDQPVELTVVPSGAPIRLGITWRHNDAEPGAVCLTRVVPGLPAYQAGLRTGDRIYEVAGRRFADSDEFQRLVTTLPPPVEVMLERHGRLRWVTLAE
jgi:S1-C subfamily serine protease